ncbi:hypothetical protein QBC46DRAFT_342815 [Diplogelasinospora grovesii]|uniref:Uncharacterized protein n=1 Tax=Diplogelasinospora grovesii TaxID=303347 RepID=A0AAN6S3L9_9PEZI|nr:hypothetical protein QBC46DRAFT_342815 [Diplogelasinospora grovesii]
MFTRIFTRKHRSTSSGDTSTRGSGHGHTTHGSGSGGHSKGWGKGSSSKTHGDKGKDSSSKTSKTHHSTGGGSSGSSSGGGGDKKGKKKKAPEPPEYQALSVIVFRGFPHDSYNKRHCGLFIEHQNDANGTWRRNMIDIEGAANMWHVRESVNRNPLNSPLFAAKLPVKVFTVGNGAEGQANRSLRDSIYNAPINNSDSEWCCQNWLEGALTRLIAAGYLSEAEKEAALNAAFDVLLQAPLQPLSIGPGSM